MAELRGSKFMLTEMMCKNMKDYVILQMCDSWLVSTNASSLGQIGLGSKLSGSTIARAMNNVTFLFFGKIPKANNFLINFFYFQFSVSQFT